MNNKQQNCKQNINGLPGSKISSFSLDLFRYPFTTSSSLSFSQREQNLVNTHPVLVPSIILSKTSNITSETGKNSRRNH